jgi:hypothetical protein
LRVELKSCLDGTETVYYSRIIPAFPFGNQEIFFKSVARVAELADALDSGSSDRKAVQVQVLSRAQ